MNAQSPSPPPLSRDGRGEVSAPAALRSVADAARPTKRASAGATPVPASTRAETAVPTPRNVVPDGCNMGTLLRVAVGVNIASFALAFVVARADFFATFLSAAAVIEPVLLGSLLTWCLLRRAALPVSAPVQRLLAWSAPAILTLLLMEMFGMLGQVTRADLMFGSVAIGFGAGAAVQHYLELRARAFSPAVTEAKLQALQSRIRPHFFFNALNAALAVVRADPPRAERMLESIAELLRAVMGDVRRLVSLEQELDLCRRYVEIEQTRLGERLVVDWQIGAVHPRAKVPQLLLQPIIENAVRYGAEKVAGNCEITVRVRQHGFNLEVFVANPIAREPIQREGNQIGLANIRGRLALIYDLEATLETRTRRERFELTLTVPVEHKANG
jgi:two-component system, LytTR family, sensor histidine kinase AlgZ